MLSVLPQCSDQVFAVKSLVTFDYSTAQHSGVTALYLIGFLLLWCWCLSQMFAADFSDALFSQYEQIVPTDFSHDQRF